MNITAFRRPGVQFFLYRVSLGIKRAKYEPSAPAAVSLLTSCDVEYFAASHTFHHRSARGTAFRNLHSSLNEVSRN